METHTFWRERETRFLALAGSDGAFDLHAFRFEVDVQAKLDELSQHTLAAIANPSATPESVYYHAWTTARAGRILLDGEQADKWILIGGSNDELARTRLQNNFKAEAMMAAVGAGEADAATTEQAALEAWLDLILRADSPHRSLGGLKHLAQASADMCNLLATQAYRAAAPDQSEQVGDRIDRLRNECGLTVEQLAEAIQLDRSSVLDHTANRAMPRRSTLKRYRDYFSQALDRRLSVQDLRDVD